MMNKLKKKCLTKILDKSERECTRLKVKKNVSAFLGVLVLEY